MRRIGRNATFAGTLTVISLESTKRLPNRAPPQLGASPLDDKASDHLVEANSRSSLTIALTIIALMPFGRIENNLRAAGSRTTVGLRILSINLRPMRA